MGQPIFTWAVTEKKRDPDGRIRTFKAKRSGIKPPKNAQHLRRVEASPATDEQEKAESAKK